MLIAHDISVSRLQILCNENRTNNLLQNTYFCNFKVQENHGMVWYQTESYLKYIRIICGITYFLIIYFFPFYLFLIAYQLKKTLKWASKRSISNVTQQHFLQILESPFPKVAMPSNKNCLLAFSLTVIPCLCLPDISLIYLLSSLQEIFYLSFNFCKTILFRNKRKWIAVYLITITSSSLIDFA